MTINSQQKSGDKLHSRSRGRTSSNSTETRYFPTALIVIVCYYTIRQVMVINYAIAEVENIPIPTIADKVLTILLLPFAVCSLLKFGKLAASLALTFGGYALISLIGALCASNPGVPQPLSAVCDIIRDAELPVIFLGFLYFCDRDIDPRRTLQLVSWFYILFAMINSPFIIRDIFGGGIGLYGQELPIRLGLPVPQGFFDQKTESAWGCFVAATCAAYVYSVRPTVYRAMLVIALSILVLVHLSAKESAALLIIGLVYQFRKASLSPATVFAAVVACVIVITVVFVSPIGDLFTLQLDIYVNEAQGAAVRTELTKTGFEIANRYFPLGSGGGTFASPQSYQFGYSQLYIDYNLNNLWGASPEKPMFLVDVFWPKIIAQSGWIGFILFLGFLWVIFSRSLLLFYRDRSAEGWICFSIAFGVLIFSIATNPYTSEFLEIAIGFFASYAFSSFERGPVFRRGIAVPTEF